MKKFFTMLFTTIIGINCIQCMDGITELLVVAGHAADVIDELLNQDDTDFLSLPDELKQIINQIRPHNPSFKNFQGHNQCMQELKMKNQLNAGEPDNIV